MKKIVIGIALGGAAGALARFAWQQMTWVSLGGSITWGVNILGCFLLAWFSTFFRNKPVNIGLILFLTTGFCGAFTTFSTWCKELFYLYQVNGFPVAAAYLVFCLFGGLLGIGLGSYIGSCSGRKELSE